MRNLHRLALCCGAVMLAVMWTADVSAAELPRRGYAYTQAQGLPQFSPEPARPVSQSEISTCNLEQQVCMQDCEIEYERRPKDGLAYKTCISRCQSDGTRCRRGIR